MVENQKCISFSWPGTTITIEESVPEKLLVRMQKNSLRELQSIQCEVIGDFQYSEGVCFCVCQGLLTDLLQLSLSPPPPDATCRIHSDTDEDRVIIYQSDPDYKVTTLPLYSLDQQYYKVATLLLYSLEQQHYKVTTLPNFNNAYVTGEVQLNFGILITNISKKYR